MDFASDNTAGASQTILASVLATNEGTAPAYGVDFLTAKATRHLEDVFERKIASFLVNTGTAANALALGAICPPFGAIFCHLQAHVMEDECGAPEMFTGGAKLIGIAGRAGKIAPADFKSVLARFSARNSKSRSSLPPCLFRKSLKAGRFTLAWSWPNSPHSRMMPAL